MPLPSLVTRLAVRECHPQRSPVMFQKWRHLLFLHGEVEVGTIQRTLPPGLQVDTFEGKDYLGLILFHGRCPSSLFAECAKPLEFSGVKLSDLRL